MKAFLSIGRKVYMCMKCHFLIKLYHKSYASVLRDIEVSTNV